VPSPHHGQEVERAWKAATSLGRFTSIGVVRRFPASREPSSLKSCVKSLPSEHRIPRRTAVQGVHLKTQRIEISSFSHFIGYQGLKPGGCKLWVQLN
jgi:hypothetical protein